MQSLDREATSVVQSQYVTLLKLKHEDKVIVFIISHLYSFFAITCIENVSEFDSQKRTGPIGYLKLRLIVLG